MQKEKSFIVYFDDNNQRVEAHVIILKLGAFVKFKTNHNIISIPRERILKIKEKVGGAKLNDKKI